LIKGASGLFVTADGADTLACDWRDQDVEVVKAALRLDMPVLASGQGLLLLNRAFGGGLPRRIAGHFAHHQDGQTAPLSHTIYLSPGSKSAAILGIGGFFKVNSRHEEGLMDNQRSPRLLASAYSMEDGVIEGLESPEHSWVIGFQANLERQAEIPGAFASLFQAFVERAQDFAASGAHQRRSC
jgi:putative glutamine amidotransferase